jgi:hypothetical protein
MFVGVVGCALVVSSGGSSNCTLCCGNGSGCCWSCHVTRGTAVRLNVVVSACCASNTLCCGNGGCWCGTGGGRRCVSSSASSQIHHDLYAGSMYAFPGGVVLVGEVALRRA